MLEALFKPPRAERAVVTAKAKEQLEEDEEARLSGLVGDDEYASPSHDDDSDDQSDRATGTADVLSPSPKLVARGSRRSRQIAEIADSESDGGASIEILN